MYDGRVLPAGLSDELTKGDGQYGLGTMLFTDQFGIGTAYGHRGEMSDHTSLPVVIPEKKLAVALLLADGNKQIDTAMAGLITALRSLVS